MTTQTQNDQRHVAVDLTAAGVSVTTTYGIDATLPFDVMRVDENGVETPIDLTGATFVATATRESGEHETSTDLPVTVVDPVAGKINVLFPFAADPYPVGTYRWELQMTDSVGTVMPLIYSTLTFINEI